MVNGSVSNSDSIAAALASVPDDVVISTGDQQESIALPSQQPPPMVLMEPWAGVNVAWVVPLAGKLLQLPYEQAAKYTKDDCWLVTDDQLEILNPAMENAIKWVVWRLGAVNAISHPMVAFGAALASLTAVKYGVYQFNEHQKKEGGPPPNQQRPLPRQQANLQPMPMDTSQTSGRTAASEGESYSQGSPAAASPGFSKKEFVIVEE